MATIYDWSSTASENDDAGTPINWLEGQLPATVNGSSREMMKQLADWRNLLGGAKISATADTMTLTSGLSLSAYAQGMMFAFECGAGNTGAATLNVDSIGAKAVVKAHDVALVSGDLETGGIYLVAYEATADNFQLLSAVSNDAGADLLTHIADTTTHGTTSAIVGVDETQTLTAKTLTAPTINGVVGGTATSQTITTLTTTNVDGILGANTPAAVTGTTGSFSGAVTASTAPSAGGHLTNKTYVDDLFTGVAGRTTVRVASTANVVIASGLENGDTIDGIVVSTGDTVLLKNQTATETNGIYDVVASGAGTRNEWFDTWAEFPGSFVTVQEGTANADTFYLCTSDTGGGTLETTAITYAQVSPQNVGTVTSVATAGLATGGPITGSGTVTVTKATGAEIDTGTEDAQAVTPKAIADSAVASGPASSTDEAVPLFDGTTGKLLKDGVAPGTSGNVLTSNGSAWTSAAATVTGPNLIINGDMAIAQRGTSFAAISNNEYSLDRWKYGASGTTGVITISQDTDVPTTAEAGVDFKSSLKVDVTTADASVAAGDISYLRYAVEGFDSAKLGYGAASAATITVSFWVKSPKTGTHSVTLSNNAGDRSYPASYTIASANTWEKHSVTIAGDTTGTWIGATNGVGLKVRFALMAGSTWTDTANTWAASNLVGATGQVNILDNTANNFFLTGVMLTISSTAPSTFATAGGSYGAELALCKRYYQKQYSGLFGVGQSSSIIMCSFDNRDMRTTPTVGNDGVVMSFANNGDHAQSSASITNNVSDANGSRYFFNNFSGLSVGYFYLGCLSGGAVIRDAEL